MRIRKREVPLPFSSLSPLPLSDPCFARSPAVQHLLRDYPLHSLSPPAPSVVPIDPPPPDHPIKPHHHHDVQPGGSLTPISPVDGDREKRDGEKRNDFREIKTLLGAEGGATSLPRSASSTHQDEKTFPMKKRWGSLESGRLSNINKKCVEMKDNGHEEKEGSNSCSGAKKRGRGGALMEGSRCSRVNGRGWRCCQPTLVGYSLCEHHLGKGRLRSMTTGSTQKKEKRASSMAATETRTGNDHEEATKSTKRRSSTKLGMVKARSISSLLDETITTTTTMMKGVSSAEARD